MQNVTRFEASLLRLLYYFLRREPFERALPLIEARHEPPAGLGAGAVRLAQDALAKGCTFLLAQRGGWRDERHLRGPKPVGGRLWERTVPEDLGLTFSQHSMRFLIWVTAARPGDKQPAWQPKHDDLSLGDLVLLFFAHEGLRGTVEGLGANKLRERAPFVHHGLCWLAYPEDYGGAPDNAKPNFKPWVEGTGACVVEALQPDLATRWFLVESEKQNIEQPPAMRGRGSAQDRALTAFLDAVEKANRRDLARFLLKAAHKLLGPGAHSGMWTGNLRMEGQRIADRAATYQAATALLRHLDRLAGWASWARAVWRFDDEYQAAQLWLEDWEQFEGDVLVGRAQTIIRNLDPMRQAAAGAAAQAT
jgi:hypothetical protein